MLSKIITQNRLITSKMQVASPYNLDYIVVIVMKIDDVNDDDDDNDTRLAKLMKKKVFLFT